MPGREHSAATPHHLTGQRLEGWLAQAPRWSQMQRRGRPGATPHGPTDQEFEA
jgi:hypothetical protein